MEHGTRRRVALFEKRLEVDRANNAADLEDLQFGKTVCPAGSSSDRLMEDFVRKSMVNLAGKVISRLFRWCAVLDEPSAPCYTSLQI